MAKRQALRYNSPMSTESSPVTKADLAALEAGLIHRIEKTETGLIERIEKTETGLLERIEKTETTLLREFRKWAVSFESRFRANEILVGGFSERMISLEERVGSLERRE